MNYYLIAPAKTFHETDNTLTYASENPLKIGQIVEIPLGKQKTVGIIVKNTTKPDFDTKCILRVLYETPLPAHIMKALVWLADYYRCPMSAVVQAILPRGITKNRRAPKPTKQKSAQQPKNPLNAAQKRALKELNACSANTVLLHGITGSGKTNIYIELAKQTLENGQSFILSA